jgi:hypothetical protein
MDRGSSGPDDTPALGTITDRRAVVGLVRADRGNGVEPGAEGNCPLELPLAVTVDPVPAAKPCPVLALPPPPLPPTPDPGTPLAFAPVLPMLALPLMPPLPRPPKVAPDVNAAAAPTTAAARCKAAKAWDGPREVTLATPTPPVPALAPPTTLPLPPPPPPTLALPVVVPLPLPEPAPAPAPLPRGCPVAAGTSVELPCKSSEAPWAPLEGVLSSRTRAELQ